MLDPRGLPLLIISLAAIVAGLVVVAIEEFAARRIAAILQRWNDAR
jgi:hypothetical protein